LLGISAPVLAESEPWIIDFGLMNYNEKDRNTGLELIVKGTRETADGGSLMLKADLDVITGATPNGASSSNVPQTFTQASGVGSYTVAANELPADDTHMDTRLGLKAAVIDPISQTLTTDYNALISMEFDYLAFAAAGGLSWDFDRKNTTLITGINLEYNLVHPVGNIPKPLATLQAPGEQQPRGVSSKSKTGREFSIGLNQIIDRTSLAQIRFTSSHFFGYLNDGYKLLSIIDNENPASLGTTERYIFENRPDSRRMKSLFLAYKKAYKSGILDVSYRFYDDSWDIKSHTLDLTYKFKLENRFFIKPKFRIYKQDAAFFYHHSLPSNEALPNFASADSRLAEFDAYTVSFEYGKNLSFGRKHSVAVEYYTQQGESNPNDAIGLQRQQDLYPTLETLTLKYIYSIKW